MTMASTGGKNDLIPVGHTTLIGTILEFDEPRGIGTVGCGERTVPFHCTAITDGSRQIEVGTVVAVRIGPARLGRLEARSVRPLVSSPGAALDGEHRPGAHSQRPDVYVPATPVTEPSPSMPVVVSAPAPEPPRPSPSVVSAAPAAAPVEPVEPVDAVEGWPVGRDSAASSWESDASATPVAGTPAVSPPAATPSVITPPAVAPAPSAPLGRVPVDTGSRDSEPEDAEDTDSSSPRPNFWSPFSVSPTGPPPTWSTPVTRRESPGDGS